MGEAAVSPLTTPDSLGAAARVFFAERSPRLLAGIVCASVAVRLALGGFALGDALVVAGVVVLWPLQEWLIHVFLLHYRPRVLFGRCLDFETARLHRAHHRDPWRLDLVLIPLRVYLLAPLLAAALFWLADPRRVASGLVVYFALALNYEWIHFLVHTRVRPRSALYRRLWRNHRLHHFRNEHYWYGVTMLSGDRLLRTAPAVDDVPVSPTARNLDGEGELREARA